MAWVFGFLLGGTLGAITGSSAAFMVNHKKKGEKWEDRIPKPLYAVRTAVTLTGVSAGALVGAYLGASIQSGLSGLPVGQHQKSISNLGLAQCDRTGLVK